MNVSVRKDIEKKLLHSPHSELNKAFLCVNESAENDLKKMLEDDSEVEDNDDQDVVKDDDNGRLSKKDGVVKCSDCTKKFNARYLLNGRHTAAECEQYRLRLQR